MAKCCYCNSTILLGGVTQGDLRFCNKKCFQDGFLLKISRDVPPDIVKRQIEQLHQGPCPKCKGPGPVDVHASHQDFSVLVLTRWSSKPQISCRSCGVKSQIGGAFISLFFGWWGFPWGLIFTPVQITRNLIGLCNAPNPAQPSPQLEKLTRLHIAAQLLAQNQASQKA